MKKIVNITALAIAICLLSQGSFAQDKPKGKEWKIPEASTKVKSPKADLEVGKEIWTKECKSCHGSKGLGDGAKAEKIDISCGNFSTKETQNLTDGELYYKTTEGRKPMPSFKDKLTDSERWAVVAYMRTLAKK